MSPTPVLGISEIPGNAANNFALVNAIARRLEQAAALHIINRTLTAPPGSPAEGDAYIVAATATGAWTGQEGNIAYLSGGGWLFIAPTNGMQGLFEGEGVYCYSETESLWFPLQPIWSTSEVWTGRYGSAATKVYQKCFSFALGDGTGTLTTAHGITNINRAALIETHAAFSNGTNVYKAPQEFTTATVVQWVNATNILTTNTGVNLTSYTLRMRLEYERTA